MKTPLMQKMNNDEEIWVFLSHSNKDYEKVRMVRDMLEDQSFRPLMFFLKCLNDEEEIDSLIKREIDCRTRFIYCKSVNAEKSRWVQEEVKYIMSKDRVFEIIDMDQPIETIRKKLEEIKRRATLFISYQSNDFALAKRVHERLNKYDLNVWFDDYSLKVGDDFEREIRHSLMNAINYGYVLVILNERILERDIWQRHELLLLDHLSLDSFEFVIPVVRDDALMDKIKKDPGLARIFSNLECIVVDSENETQQCDSIVNAVLKKVFPPGAIWAHAHSFLHGTNNNKKDIVEAEKLFSLCFEIASEREKNGSPTGNGVLAYCYEHGYGTEQDLDMARDYYFEASKLFPQYKEDYFRLTKLLCSDHTDRQNGLK